MPRKGGHRFGRWVKRQKGSYTLDDVSIHSVTTKIEASFLTQLPERKETAQGFHHEANGDFKTEFLMAVTRRKLRMDQHSYLTIVI